MIIPDEGQDQPEMIAAIMWIRSDTTVRESCDEITLFIDRNVLPGQFERIDRQQKPIPWF
jgi:hypothetical protein